MRTGRYHNNEREMVEDKIDMDYVSLLCLVVRNRALVLENIGNLWRETGFIMGRDTNSKFVVRVVDLIHSRLIVSSAFCSLVKDREVICKNCAELENEL